MLYRGCFCTPLPEHAITWCIQAISGLSMKRPLSIKPYLKINQNDAGFVYTSYSQKNNLYGNPRLKPWKALGLTPYEKEATWEVGLKAKGLGAPFSARMIHPNQLLTGLKGRRRGEARYRGYECDLCHVCSQ